MVVPEITPGSRAALAEGLITMAIATPLPALCRELVARMIARVADGAADGAGPDLPAVRHLPAGEHLTVMVFSHGRGAMLSSLRAPGASRLCVRQGNMMV